MDKVWFIGRAFHTFFRVSVLRAEGAKQILANMERIIAFARLHKFGTLLSAARAELTVEFAGRRLPCGW